MTDPEEVKQFNQPENPMAEAGISNNFYLVHKETGAEVQVTIRWPNLWDFESFNHYATEYLKAKAVTGWRIKTRNVETPFVSPTTPAQAAIETGKAAPEPVGQPAPQGALSKAINIIKVLPQPGDKVNVEFWQTGRKYAELYAKGWSLDRVRNLLSTVTKHDPAKPAELPLNCTVTYTLGKEYKPGKHYEDVQAIYPA